MGKLSSNTWDSDGNDSRSCFCRYVPGDSRNRAIKQKLNKANMLENIYGRHSLSLSLWVTETPGGGGGNKQCDKLTAYRKNNSCETALLSLTENWKFVLDEHNVVGVLSTDMSKAFDSLYHPLTLAKRKAYGVEERSRSAIDGFLLHRPL